MLKIIPLGGLGEIGLNMMVLEFGETMFVIDAGLMFPEDYMLGIDWVIPDMAYLKGTATISAHHPDPWPRGSHRGAALSAQGDQRTGFRNPVHLRTRAPQA